ncbi:N-acetylmuramidase domain-containing protein [Pseudomonas sp. S2_G10]
MASLLARLFGLHRYSQPTLPAVPRAPILPTPDTRFVATPASPVPLKNWCHPFKDKQRSKDTRNPLEQLTHLAKAAGGYYPVGRSGLFHGGIHFDGGTAGTLDQSSVRCLADGEVVAYRIDTHSPTTRYYVGQVTVDKPFSRNFVLVRHRLQPPRIEGSADIPPSLTFYSLYMHLQDWAKYEKNNAIERPAYWPASPILRVPQTAKDIRPGTLEYGLNVRHQPSQGKIIDFLPRGAEVSVSGTGAYRRLENRQGPAKLITAEGSLAGYLAASLLQPVGGSEYSVTSSEPSVNVHAQPSRTSEVLLQLLTGSVVTVSGEGDFRKLERVHQYVHFASLESELAPQATDRIMVLDQPVPIQAGALIGHLGQYQDMRAERPEEELHLEVFTGDDVDLFLDASRAWAERLPTKERIWLKLVEGTPVVPHEEPATAARLQASSDASPRSAADLLVPKSVLDGLPPEGKIHVPATEHRKARNWYRLDRLLHNADHNPLDGWVCEEVGVTPWLSPWSWEGYGVIFDYSTPRHEMASFFSAVGRFNDAQRERFRPLAEKNNQGPMKSRLYAIIDRTREGKITAEELQAALRLPALAQAISQMILRKESEWFHQTPKWDALDELLGHSGSTPHWNWEAEKQRIEQISWWGEVAQIVGLPTWGRPYHFHPIGLITHLSNYQKKCYCYQQGLVDNPCNLGVTDITKKHFELLADELGVEREVLRAIAVAETGDKSPFREYEVGKRHALILYERHYMRRLLLASGMSQSEINALSISEPKIVHAYEASYVYGSLDEQYSRFKRAREINHAAAIKSCSWGKFQVMGEYYRHLYSSIEELEEAQNYCALQHLQYFKVFLVKEKKLMEPMKNKDWLLIAQKYNGKGQIGYDVKIRSAYDSLKQNW